MSQNDNSAEASKAGQDRKGSIFTRENYMMMFAGIVVILIGFVLMAGGGSEDPEVFNTDAIYSPRRVTIAPLVVLIGFGIEIYAIFHRPSA